MKVQGKDFKNANYNHSNDFTSLQIRFSNEDQYRMKKKKIGCFPFLIFVSVKNIIKIVNIHRQYLRQE